MNNNETKIENKNVGKCRNCGKDGYFDECLGMYICSVKCGEILADELYDYLEKNL